MWLWLFPCKSCGCCNILNFIQVKLVLIMTYDMIRLHAPLKLLWQCTAISISLLDFKASPKHNYKKSIGKAIWKNRKKQLASRSWKKLVKRVSLLRGTITTSQNQRHLKSKQSVLKINHLMLCLKEETILKWLLGLVYSPVLAGKFAYHPQAMLYKTLCSLSSLVLSLVL